MASIEEKKKRRRLPYRIKTCLSAGVACPLALTVAIAAERKHHPNVQLPTIYADIAIFVVVFVVMFVAWTVLALMRRASERNREHQRLQQQTRGRGRRARRDKRIA